MMQSSAVALVTGLAMAAFSSVAVAENLVVYPAKGQSAQPPPVSAAPPEP